MKLLLLRYHHEMSLVTQIAIVTFLAYLFHLALSFVRNRIRLLRTFSSASIPGPVPSFVKGNFAEYLCKPHETLDRWVREYGAVFGYFQGGRPFLVLSDPDDVQEVLVKLGTKLPNRQESIIVVEPFESALILERGNRWKRSRRILSPAFTAHKMTLQTSKLIINESVNRLFDTIHKRQSLDKFNLTFHLKCCSLDIITRLAFNMEPVDLYAEQCELRELIFEFLEHPTNGPIALTAYFPFLEKIFFLLLTVFGSGKMISVLEGHLKKSIKEYTAPQKETKVNLLDFMLEQKQIGNLNDLEVMGNSLLVLLAGYETSAVSQMFTLYLLAKHPEIQEQLRQELSKLMPEGGDDDPCYFDEHRCELLDRVWYESMRVYPPAVDFITRKLDESIPQLTLEKCGITISQEMTVQIPVRAIHHNATHWPDPYRFKPDRANLPENLASNTNCAFIPFGAEPRNCIGRFVALSEARAVISRFVLKYRFELAQPELDEHFEPESGLLNTTCSSAVMHPAKNIYLKLIPIQ